MEMRRLVDESIARAEWENSARHPDPEWWFGYRQALRDLTWVDGGG